MEHIQLFEDYHNRRESNAVNERQYWGSIGAGILPVCPSTGRILVGLRSSYVMEPNTWGTFGGKLDIDEGIDETIKMAAMRELEEETCFEGHMELVNAYVYQDGDRFSYHNFFGVVEEEFRPRLNWENDKAVWFTLAEVGRLAPKHFGLSALLKNSMNVLTRLLGDVEPEMSDDEEYAGDDDHFDGEDDDNW